MWYATLNGGKVPKKTANEPPYQPYKTGRSQDSNLNQAPPKDWNE